MSETFKTASKSVFGIITSLGAANVPKVARNIGRTAETICSIISVVIAIITVIYIYYKMKNEKLEYEENKEDG